MDIPVDAQVVCLDGPAGRSTCVVLNPITRRLTHVVVAEPSFPHDERLVPVDLVLGSTPHEIHLNVTREELAHLEPFTEVEFIQSELSYRGYDWEEYRLWPYALPEDEMVSVESEQVPPGELAIHRGAQVRAMNGHVGQVDEFLVNAADGHITHLVLREGHLWGQKDVAIPVSAIGRIEEDIVYLNLDRHGIEELPAIPVRRHAQ